MKLGQCKLCSNHRELQESHIWSRFGYGRYVSDQSKGGRFVDLMQGESHNKQYKREWLCKECEARFGDAENYTARLLKRLEKQPASSHQHDDHLLRFVTSISWRTVLFGLGGQLDRKEKGDAARFESDIVHKTSCVPNGTVEPPKNVKRDKLIRQLPMFAILAESACSTVPFELRPLFLPDSYGPQIVFK